MSLKESGSSSEGVEEEHRIVLNDPRSFLGVATAGPGECCPAADVSGATVTISIAPTILRFVMIRTLVRAQESHRRSNRDSAIRRAFGRCRRRTSYEPWSGTVLSNTEAGELTLVVDLPMAGLFQFSADPMIAPHEGELLNYYERSSSSTIIASAI